MKSLSTQSHTTEKWVDAFINRERNAEGILPYFTFTISNMMPFLTQLSKAITPGSRVLEIGCGPCFLSIWMSHLATKHLNVYALEYDEKVLSYARRNIEFFRAPVRLIHGDMFALPFSSDSCDVIYHDGLLEHFSDDELRRALAEQMRVARKIVLSIPVARAKGFKDLYGDERLMNYSSWKELFNSTGVARVDSVYGSTPPKDFLSRTLWYAMGYIGCRKYRKSLASAVTFTLSRID